jgi:hypothetical protein
MKIYLVGSTLQGADRITKMYETFFPAGHFMGNPEGCGIAKKTITKKPYMHPTGEAEKIKSEKIYIAHAEYIPGAVNQPQYVNPAPERLANRIEIGECEELKLDVITL